MIDIFEQQASFGGVWNYSPEALGTITIPQTDPNLPQEKPFWRPSKPNHDGEPQATFITPMYEHLETNIPHLIMKHTDKPLENNPLFPSRQTIQSYLSDYALDIQHLVHFQTQVTSVRHLPFSDQSTWLVRTRNLRTDEFTEDVYDAVLVANGHYTVPFLPAIKGISAWNAAYPGTINHSKFYRRPDGYAGKKVLIIGNSASGTDIASQIGAVSGHPLLLSSRSKSVLFPFEAEYKEDVPEIEEFLPPGSKGGKEIRAVRFVDGRVESGIDAVLFATGYLYSFPFLDSLRPRVISTGMRVENLYQHIFYIPEPSLAFLGLPSKIVPFRTFEGQAAVISRIWSGRSALPSIQEMKDWEEHLVKEKGAGKAFHVLDFPMDFEYHNEMVEWAQRAEDEGAGRGKISAKWNERETWARGRFPAVKRKFVERGQARRDVRTMEELGFDYEEWVREYGTGKNGVGR